MLVYRHPKYHIKVKIRDTLCIVLDDSELTGTVEVRVPEFLEYRKIAFETVDPKLTNCTITIDDGYLTIRAPEHKEVKPYNGELHTYSTEEFNKPTFTGYQKFWFSLSKKELSILRKK